MVRALTSYPATNYPATVLDRSATLDNRHRPELLNTRAQIERPTPKELPAHERFLEQAFQGLFLSHFVLLGLFCCLRCIA